MASFKQSQVLASGIKGTYTTTYGGTGLGYRMTVDGVEHIVKSGGNGFYYPVDGLASFAADNGNGYMGKVRGLNLPPAYRYAK